MTSKITEAFVCSVDNNRNDYTLDELKKLLTEAYKVSKKKRSNNGEKKAPSQYNIFIKDEIAKIREENPNVDNKQLMSLAAARWKDHKEKIVAGINDSDTNCGE